MPETKYGYKQFASTLVVLCGLFVYSNFQTGFAQSSVDEFNDSIDYWLEITKEQPDNGLAWFSIGVLYEKGQSVERDIEKAKSAYDKSVKLDYAPAMFNLGSIYSSQKNYLKARLWWEEAAHENVPEAQYNLATLYEKGWGVEQNPAKATFWYQRAAETAMSKYFELYQESKQQRQNKPDSKDDGLSIFNGFSIINTAMAASDLRLDLLDSKEKINHLLVTQQGANQQKVTQPVQVAQQEAVVSTQDVIAKRASESSWPWVYSQPGENFTIQLFATKQPSKTAKFIQKYAITDKAHIIPAIVKGTQYYKVIWGSFSEWNDAAVEIGTLPQDLRDQRPWVRKFSSLYPELPEGTPTAIDQSDSQPTSDSQSVKELGSSNDANNEQAETELTTEVTNETQTAVTDESANKQVIIKESIEVIENNRKRITITDDSEQSLSESDIESDGVFSLYTRRQLNSPELDDSVKQSLRSAFEAANANDHKKAFEQFTALAQTGLSEAQFRIALSYTQGQGVEKDIYNAFKYMKLAAEQGHPYAQKTLSEFYANGIGVEQNAGLADYWRQTAQDNIKKLAESA